MLSNLDAVLAVVTKLPFFSATEINWAADVFRKGDQRSAQWPLAVAHVNAWRTAHEGAVAQMRPPLTVAGLAVDDQCIVASRLKRLPTIIGKCSRLPQGVTLWEMQDVGGLRVIVNSPSSVYELARLLRESPPPKFKFEWLNDYLEKPKRGYRSLHHIYSFEATSEDQPQLQGLRVEVQMRSRLQHAWATAEEMTGTFLRQGLKFGKGDADWRRYFLLAGALLALREGLPVGPNVPKNEADLRMEFEALERKLNAFEKITAYSMTPLVASKEKLGVLHGNGYAVLTADVESRELTIMVFGPHQFSLATAEYQQREKKYAGNADRDTVLVHLGDIAQLEEAYPNYWADTGDFLHAVYPDFESRINPKTLRFR